MGTTTLFRTLIGLACLLMIATSASSSSMLAIGECKSLPDTTQVQTDYSVVTAVFGDSYYIEQQGRACGIRVSAPGTSHSIGDQVSVTGTLTTDGNGERFLSELDEAPKTGKSDLPPLFLTLRNIGGGNWLYNSKTGAGQEGVTGYNGLNTIGLLVRVCGVVKEIDPASVPTWFTIDDGSGTAVRVAVPSGVTISNGWENVVVTGVCSRKIVDNKDIPIILARGSSDIVTNGNQLVAALVLRPDHAAPGENVTFDGLLSQAGMPGRGIATYQWDFNYDGHTFDVDATGPTPSHSYPRFGTYTVALRVTDSGNPARSDVATASVTVDQGNLPPVAIPAPVYYVSPSSFLVLDASNSSDPDSPAGDSIANYAWDTNNDGAYDFSSSSPVTSVPWTQLQTLAWYHSYPITLRVTDTFGAVSTKSSSFIIESAQPTPVFTQSASSVAIGQTVSLDATRSTESRPDHHIVSYEWDFHYVVGGNFVAEATGATQAYSYDRFGVYNIALRVTDDAVPAVNNIVFHSVNVVIGNHPPVAACGGPYIIDQGSGLTLDGSGSCDPDASQGDRLAQYSWDLNGDGAYTDATGATPTLTWSQLQALGLSLGTYVAHLRVTDAFGNSSEVLTKLSIYKNQPVPVIVVPNETMQSNVSFSLDGSQSTQDRPGRSIVSYEWDLSYDGVTFNTETTGVKPLVSYPATGSFTIALRVMDNNVPARSVIATTTIQIVSTAQTIASPGGPYVINIGDTLNLDGSASTPIPGYPLAGYTWDLNDDGGFIDANGPQASVLWGQLAVYHSAAGKYNIHLKVSDTWNHTDVGNTTLTIYNNVPNVVMYTYPSTTAAAGQSILFDAQGSYHGRPDRGIVSCEWDFDYDGTNFTPDATGVTVSHSYSISGSRRVALRVTDNNSPAKTAIVSKIITVTYLTPPVSVPGGPYYTNVGDALQLDGSRSYDPDSAYGDYITNYQWFLNDTGTSLATGSRPYISWSYIAQALQHAYLPTTGTFQLILRATDSAGRTADAYTSLGIYNNQPTAVIDSTVTQAAPGQPITFSGARSSIDRPDSQIVSCEWDFDYNGSFAADATGVSVTHSYPAFGSYTCALRVTDNNSPCKTSIATVAIAVNQGNLAPVAHPGGPYTLNAGSQLTVDGSASWDPNAAAGDRIVSYAWDLNDDGVYNDASGQNVTIPWAHLAGLGLGQGSHTIRLQVTDTFGSVNRSYTRLEIK